MVVELYVCNDSCQICEWMSRNKSTYLRPTLVAEHLGLVHTVRGINEAEKFFNGLKEDYLVGYPVYVALLGCYTEKKFIHMAEATMDSIRKFERCSPVPYNMMLSLYCTCRQHEKLDAMVQEMQEKGIPYNDITYGILLKGYAGSDPEKMEKTLMEMELNDQALVYFHHYAKAAKGYIQSGAEEKAYELLKKAESLLDGKPSNYVILISYYADMQKKEDVYRVLDPYLNLPGLWKRDYGTIISSLVKLDDLERANMIAEQWDGMDSTFDIRIPNLVISGYCKKGDVREAEIIVKRLVDSGKELDAHTFSHMAGGYVRNGEMEKAVDMEMKAFRASSLSSWLPNNVVAEACLEYLQRKGDVGRMHEFLTLLEKYSNPRSPTESRNSERVKETLEKFSGNRKPKNGLAVNDLYVPTFTSID